MAGNWEKKDFVVIPENCSFFNKIFALLQSGIGRVESIRFSVLYCYKFIDLFLRFYKYNYRSSAVTSAPA